MEQQVFLDGDAHIVFWPQRRHAKPSVSLLYICELWMDFDGHWLLDSCIWHVEDHNGEK